MLTTMFLLVILVSVCLGVMGSIMTTVIMRRYEKQDLDQAKFQKRLEELEADAKARQPKRHTHATNAGLEDALAVAIDVLNEYYTSQKYTQARVKQLQEILKIVRSGPLEYDDTRPAGRRPVRDE